MQDCFCILFTHKPCYLFWIGSGFSIMFFHTCILYYIRQKKQQDGSAATAEEIEFSDQFARECAFIATLSTITPSSISWGDRVDEDRLTHSSDSEGDQTQCPWTDSEWVTGPPSIATGSEQPSRQRDGATASVHQRMMRRSSRASQRLEPHMAYETGR